MGIDIDRIVVALKASLFSRDAARLGLDVKGMLEYYRANRKNGTGIYQSHLAQQEAEATFAQFLRPAQLLQRHLVTAEVVGPASLLVILGGDNSVSYYSQFARDTPVLLVNSDPGKSAGAMTHFTAADFQNSSALDRLAEGDFEIDAWRRLEAKIDGEVIGHAMSEVFLGVLQTIGQARYVVRKIGKKFQESAQHRGGGFIVATPAGTQHNSWYDASMIALGKDHAPLGFHLNEARYAAHVPNRKSLGQPHLQGVLLPGEVIHITQQSNSEGVIALDPKDGPKVDFHAGSEAEVRISELPLHVITRFKA